jgi:hypothetical protein
MLFPTQNAPNLKSLEFANFPPEQMLWHVAFCEELPPPLRTLDRTLAKNE